MPHTLGGMKITLYAGVALVLAAVATSPARAEEQGSAWGIALGVFSPQADGSGSGYALSIFREKRLQSGLRLGIEANLLGAKYATPPGVSCGSTCTVDSSMTFNTVGFGGRLTYAWPIGAGEIYAGGGAALYLSSMKAQESGFVLFIPVSGEIEENDHALGGDLRAGIAFPFTGTRASFGLEVRRLWLSGDFGQLSSGKLQLGGTSVLLTLTQRF